MIDWPETRLQLQLWLHQSWPFRVLARVRMRGVPDAQGFGKFREGSETLDEAVTRLRADILKLESPEAAVPGENATAPKAGSIPKLREARPESAAELLDEFERFAALQKSHPGQYELKISLFGRTCSLEDADAVLTAADPLQAARDLMTKKLNESECK